MAYKKKDSLTKVGNIHNIPTRQRDDLYVPFARCKVVYESPNYMSLRLFNRLPESIRHAEHLYIFKSELKKHLLSKCYYSVGEMLC